MKSNIIDNKLNESILDVPMKDLYEGVIKDDKMTPECRGQIIETIKLWKKQINFDFNIYNIWAKGSLLTKRYNDTTDLDVSIYTDMTSEQLNQVMSIVPKGQNIIVNGQESTHPLDFYVLVKGDKADLANFDSVYDVARDKWVKRSDDYENEIPLNYLMDVSNFFINGCSIAIQNYENDKVLYEYYNSLDPSSQEISEDEKEEHLARKKEDLKADLDALRVALRMISSFRTQAYTDGGMSLQIDIKSDNPHVTIQEQLAKILEKFGIRQKLRQYVDECSKLLGVKNVEDVNPTDVPLKEALNYMTSLRLKEDNITGNVLKHMIHSEDLILTGKSGSKLLLRTFRDIFNALKGNTPTSRITQKIDGAPAVIAATDFHGKKFVALKHSWDKGKIFQSIEEVREVFGDRPDLCAKMEYLFNSLDAINIPKDEIWHGDFLYHKDDLRTDTIDGKEYILFRPNTIVYAIPVDDPLAETILKSTIGVAWHTKYTGESFDDIHISFDVSVSSVNEIPEVYQMDARIPSLVGRVTMTSEETDRAEGILDSLDLMVQAIIVDENYESLVSDANLILLLNTYRNAIIKDSNRQFPDIQGFKTWISDRYEKEKEKKKTDKGKATVEEKKQAILSVVDDNNDLILRIYEAQKFATDLKEIFINKLNSLSSMRSFVSHISQGYISTSGEGFAVSDVDGNVYKLVSRLEFSRNNFSKEIIKGWQSEKRMNESSIMKHINESRKGEGRTVALTFGRYQVPTYGHLLLWRKLAETPADDHFIYTSHTQDNKKNPLSYETKVALIKEILRNKNVDAEIKTSDARTLMDVCINLSDQYDNLIFVAGGDRIDEILSLLKKYNGVDTPKGKYEFLSIEGRNAGQRDPDADDITGVSGTKARQIALEGDLDKFSKIVPISDLQILEDVMHEVQNNLIKKK